MDTAAIQAAVGAMRSIQVADVTINYIEQGEGEPVVLLHGYPESPLAYRHQIEVLSGTHRVIAPQWPGWGASTRDLSFIPEYNLEVGRLAQFLEALDLKRFNLVAHDYGGLLSLGFTIRYPERVIRYALLNCRAHRTFPLRYYGQFMTWERSPDQLVCEARFGTCRSVPCIAARWASISGSAASTKRCSNTTSAGWTPSRAGCG